MRSRPSKEKDIERLVRELGGYLAQGDLRLFEQRLREAGSAAALAGAKSQKILTRAGAQTRAEAGEIMVAAARLWLDPDAAAEFGRYVTLSNAISLAREPLAAEVGKHLRRMPKLSLAQLLEVAERSFDYLMDRAYAQLPKVEEDEQVNENERRLHEQSGYANDSMFAVLRALNEASRRAGARDLTRPDALQKARPIFVEAAIAAGLVNSLDYVLDSASYGDFVVSEADAISGRFRLEISDIRGALIRLLSIRRTFIHILTGHREPRFVREQLRKSHPALLHAMLNEYLYRTGAPLPADEEIRKLEEQAEKILRQIDAEDDLLYAAAGETIRPAVLYHVSAALRWAALAADLVATKLPARARRQFGREIPLDLVLEGLVRSEEREAAKGAWEELTTELPTNGHFSILRRPFIRTGLGSARPIIHGLSGTWATVVRELINKGGGVGRGCGAMWEHFLAQSFEQTDWTTLGRNINIVHQGKKLTEVDLLTLREDLLLVIEVKALTGSGLSTYDHWKNRLIIEKGCRQAALAAWHIKAHPELIASVADKKTAQRIRHVQPLVLTNESMFDGWNYDGVPVAGETTRKAITVGTKVDYYDGRSLQVQRIEWHLRPEDLSSETILAALSDPIELKLAPERGDVAHFPLKAGGLEILIPVLMAKGDPPNRMVR